MCSIVRLLVISVALMIAGCAHSTFKLAESTSLKRVILESSEIFDLYSSINDYNYRIKVNLPGGYQENTDRKYPVILKLDGQWDFPLAAGAYNCVYFDGQMPETIVVGIGWGDVVGDIHAIRARDLMPTAVDQYTDSGNAKQFIEVLTKEIIPELENRFRLDGQKFLMGTSMSALFATYALLEQPETFGGAIAIGADFRSAENELYKMINSYANTDRLSGKRLYLGVGSWDAIVPSVLAMKEELIRSNLSGFKLLFEEAPGYGHSSMNLPGYANGYRYMFERDNIHITQGELARFYGVYTTGTQGEEISIGASEAGLVAQTSRGEVVQLRAKSKNAFYNPGMFFNVRFEGDKALVETFFGTQQLLKVK